MRHHAPHALFLIYHNIGPIILIQHQSSELGTAAKEISIFTEAYMYAAAKNYNDDHNSAAPSIIVLFCKLYFTAYWIVLYIVLFHPQSPLDESRGFDCLGCLRQLFHCAVL